MEYPKRRWFCVENTVESVDEDGGEALCLSMTLTFLQYKIDSCSFCYPVLHKKKSLSYQLLLVICCTLRNVTLIILQCTKERENNFSLLSCKCQAPIT